MAKPRPSDPFQNAGIRLPVSILRVLRAVFNDAECKAPRGYRDKWIALLIKENFPQLFENVLPEERAKQLVARFRDNPDTFGRTHVDSP
jgi:hypothetical protein